VRVEAPVGFEIDAPIEPHPIFALIERHAEVTTSEMFEVFNMGTGFCYVVAPAAADRTLAILHRHGRTAQRIGRAVANPEKKIRIPQRNVVGRHKSFVADTRTARKAG
jgi:phosphoribosylformylglycinamidine cyclo-ligase